MDHVMLDLETMGTGVDALVIAIGAVKFSPDTGKLGDTFYRNIDWQSGIDAGRVIDSSTVAWWLRQSDAARRALFKGDLEDWSQTLHQFKNWFSNSLYIWSNGIGFDIAIIEDSFAKNGTEAPWLFRNTRDVRTIKHLADHLNIDSHIPEELAHNALKDAKHQATYVSKMWQNLKQF